MTFAPVSFAQARAIADTVLFEGHLLHPDRASAPKNRLRWQFGVLGPPRWSQAHAEDRWAADVQFLVQAHYPLRLSGLFPAAAAQSGGSVSDSRRPPTVPSSRCAPISDRRPRKPRRHVRRQGARGAFDPAHVNSERWTEARATDRRLPQPPCFIEPLTCAARRLSI
jgi:hypothetical protein